MTVSKLTNPPSQKGVIDKVNEIIDSIGGSGTSLTAGNGININSNDEIDIMQEDIGGLIPNYSVQGSPTVTNDAILVAPDDSNYLLLDNVQQSTITSAEFGFSIIASDFPTGGGGSEYLYMDSSLFHFGIYKTGTSDCILRFKGQGSFDLTGNTVLSLNTRYWVKCIFDTTNGTKILISTDGINYSQDASMAISFSPLTQPSSYYIGRSVGGGGNYWHGNIYLEDVYMNINGVDVWRAVTVLPSKECAKATTSLYGLIKPDGNTITVNNGVISANIPTVNNATITLTQGGITKGTFTTNQGTDATIALDAGGGTSLTAGNGIEINQSDEIDIIQSGEVITQNNYTIVNNVTIDTTTTLATNALENGYLDVSPSPFSGTINNFAFQIAINPVESYFNICGSNGTNSNAGILIALTTYMIPVVYIDGTVSLQDLTLELQRNVKAYLRVEYDSTNGYKLKYSTDGENWAVRATNSSTTLPTFASTDELILLKAAKNNSTSYIGGGIYLNETFVEINGVEVWRAISEVVDISKIALATQSLYGLVKPDGATITINDGVLTAHAGQRNIGEIVTSTIPLTDAGLHLLDGSLISGSGIYSEFVTYIADLHNSGTSPAIFATETDWQNLVATYGVCGKFVYDSVNNTVRLPKITGIVEGTTDLTVLGDLVQAGLPIPSHTHTRGDMNITGSSQWQGVSPDGTASGALSRWNSSGGETYGGYGSAVIAHLDFNASNSWTGSTSQPNGLPSIYGNSSTVQPQTIKVLYYIVIATTTKNEIEVDIDDIATDLNGKADTDLTNLSAGLTNTICSTSPTTTSSASSARPAVVIQNYINGASWYRVWSDKWCEQGGYVVTGGSVTYLKAFADTNYTLVASGITSSSNSTQYRQIMPNSYTSTGFTGSTSSGVGLKWYACGYIS